MKTHIHEEQFDGVRHAWCGRGAKVVFSDEFEATPPERRCLICDREWFPNGQPEWHYRIAVEAQQEKEK